MVLLSEDPSQDDEEGLRLEVVWAQTQIDGFRVDDAHLASHVGKERPVRVARAQVHATVE